MNQSVLTKKQLEGLSKDELMDTILDLQIDLARQQEENAVLKQKLFGRGSEKSKYIDSDQITVFNEAEGIVDEGPVEEPTIEETITYTRKKRTGKRDEDLKGLPAEIVMHELSEEELKETFQGNAYIRLPDDVYRKLEVVPAQFKVVEHHLAVYKCNKTGTIVKAPHPKEMLNNSIATPSLVASIMNAKFTNAMPFYRLEKDMEQTSGVHISRQNMAHWVIRCAEDLLDVIYERLKKQMLQAGVLQADETTVEVTKDGRPAGSKSYMWVYRTSERIPEAPIILYDYEKTRNSEHPEEFLKGFRGTLMCDGYSGYKSLDNRSTEIATANCFAHARRPFADIVKAMPSANKRKGMKAAIALEKIAKIYEEEEKLKDLPSNERLKYRHEFVKPLVEDYFAWAKETIDLVLPSSLIGKAIAYSLAREKALKAFLDNGDIPIDNSACERSIRPFTIARKNFVMIDTVSGAKASAIVFSLVETAKANNLNVYKYLMHLLTEIPKHLDDTDRSFIEELLPWSANIQERYKMN